MAKAQKARVGIRLVLLCALLEGCRPSLVEHQLRGLLARSSTLEGSGEVYVEAASGVPIAALVRMPDFRGLWPGISHPEAQEILGETAVHYQEWARDDVYRFAASAGEPSIEIVRQLSGSEEKQFEQWYLRAAFANTKQEAVLGRGLMEILHRNPGTHSLHVNAADADIKVELSSGSLSRIWWLRRAT